MLTEVERTSRVASVKIRSMVNAEAPLADAPYWKHSREWACVVVFDAENGRWCQQIERELADRLPSQVIVKCLCAEHQPPLLGLRLRHAFKIGDGDIPTALRMVVFSKMAIDAPKDWTPIEL